MFIEIFIQNFYSKFLRSVLWLGFDLHHINVFLWSGASADVPLSSLTLWASQCSQSEDRNPKWSPSSKKKTSTDNDGHPFWHRAASKWDSVLLWPAVGWALFCSFKGGWTKWRLLREDGVVGGGWGPTAWWRAEAIKCDKLKGDKKHQVALVFF